MLVVRLHLPPEHYNGLFIPIVRTVVRTSLVIRVEKLLYVHVY
jgi:hypothetical protein